MTIQEAMKQAVEGGYHRNGADGRETDNAGAHRACSAWTRNDTDAIWVAGVKDALLDPHFWRALGLALGWHERVERQYLLYEQWWRQPWHRFIDHLADGYPPEAFFARVPCPSLQHPAGSTYDPCTRMTKDTHALAGLAPCKHRGSRSRLAQDASDGCDV